MLYTGLICLGTRNTFVSCMSRWNLPCRFYFPGCTIVEKMAQQGMQVFHLSVCRLDLLFKIRHIVPTTNYVLNWVTGPVSAGKMMLDSV